MTWFLSFSKYIQKTRFYCLMTCLSCSSLTRTRGIPQFCQRGTIQTRFCCGLTSVLVMPGVQDLTSDPRIQVASRRAQVRCGRAIMLCSNCPLVIKSSSASLLIMLPRESSGIQTENCRRKPTSSPASWFNSSMSLAPPNQTFGYLTDMVVFVGSF